MKTIERRVSSIHGDFDVSISLLSSPKMFELIISNPNGKGIMVDGLEYPPLVVTGYSIKDAIVTFQTFLNSYTSFYLIP